MNELEPIDPGTAVEMYIQSRERELADATLYSHRSRLGFFTQWCDDEQIENLNNLSGRDLHRYRLWRRSEGDLAPTTEKTQMDTVRVFIRWLETIDGVKNDLHIKVQSPTLKPGENVRDKIIDSEPAAEILTYLSKYQYAGYGHVVFLLLWKTMMRRGSLRSLDVEDYNPEEQYLSVKNRPNTGTRLKNGDKGERYISLRKETCNVLDDWIAEKRPDVVDDHGREPLIASVQGRSHIGTIQSYVYGMTRPCFWGNVCPHEREIEECKSAKSRGQAFACPSSEGPHALRRGSITHNLKEGKPEKVVSDRADVSPDVIEKHYDRRSPLEKMEQRREYFESD